MKKHLNVIFFYLSVVGCIWASTDDDISGSKMSRYMTAVEGEQQDDVAPSDIAKRLEAAKTEHEAILLRGELQDFEENIKESLVSSNPQMADLFVKISNGLISEEEIEGLLSTSLPAGTDIMFVQGKLVNIRELAKSYRSLKITIEKLTDCAHASIYAEAKTLHIPYHAITHPTDKIRGCFF